MASDDDSELTQTQSQNPNTQEKFFKKNLEEDKDIWGRLLAKNPQFCNVGKYNVCNSIHHCFN